MVLCLISCFLLWKPMRLIEITGKMESLMVISTKKGSNFHSFLQHSYTRRHFISSRDNNLTKENRGLGVGSLCLFHQWDSQGWSHFAAGNAKGSPLLVSALDSKSAVVHGQGSADAGGLWTLLPPSWHLYMI